MEINWTAVESVAAVAAVVAAVAVPIGLFVAAGRRKNRAHDDLTPRVEALEVEASKEPDLIGAFERGLMGSETYDGTPEERLAKASASWRLSQTRTGNVGDTYWRAENRTGADAFNVKATGGKRRIVQAEDPVDVVPAWSAFEFIDCPTFADGGKDVSIAWDDENGERHTFGTRLV